MRGRTFPAFVKFVGEPTIEAHSRGAVGDSGQGLYGVAGGARWVWTIAVRSLSPADALRLRAWLHSLRGASGTFTAAMPLPRVLVPGVGSGFGYSDDTLHTDDTDYDDHIAANGGPDTYAAPTVDSGTAFGALRGADLVVFNGFLPNAGDYLRVTTDAGPQVVACWKAVGNVAYIRPRLRAQVSGGALAERGPVLNTWRLKGHAPAVPLIVGRSLPLTIDIEEAY